MCGVCERERERTKESLFNSWMRVTSVKGTFGKVVLCSKPVNYHLIYSPRPKFLKVLFIFKKEGRF